jgi:hypothetical protein
MQDNCIRHTNIAIMQNIYIRHINFAIMAAALPNREAEIATSVPSSEQHSDINPTTVSSPPTHHMPVQHGLRTITPDSSPSGSREEDYELVPGNEEQDRRKNIVGRLFMTL